MPTVFFIADTHFGHKNIIQYEPLHRPFATIEEHDTELIQRWNSVVSPKDIVYHLGDFAFGKKNIAVAALLNGRKRLIMGNHDCYPAEEYLKYFERVFGSIFYKNYILSHIPLHPNHARAMMNIHGHLHSKMGPVCENENDPIYFNVSVEQIGLKPISLEEIEIKAYRNMK
jgi:calcineurin-like phosphoesterase family protein